MGTTLTGTTPQDTYDSLIKVTDNGPLSATAKYLSDGLGNDSALALSTTAVGIGTNNPSVTLSVFGPAGSPNVLSLSGANSNCDMIMQSASTSSATRLRNTVNDFQIHTNGVERVRVDSAGNVGIGTSSPSYKLAVAGIGSDATQSQTYVGNNDQLGFIGNYVPSGTFTRFFDIVASGAADGTNGESNIRFFTNGVASTTKTEKLRILANGGITFNGDTAAANALDDYEEGTWTPVIRGSSTAGTYELASPVAAYTKIGRQVTVTAQISTAGTVTGGGSGYAQITGLPFANLSQAIGSIYVSGVDFSGSYLNVAFISASAQTIIYFPETNDNSTVGELPISAIGAFDSFVFTLTYFV